MPPILRLLPESGLFPLALPAWARVTPHPACGWALLLAGPYSSPPPPSPLAITQVIDLIIYLVISPALAAQDTSLPAWPRS